MASRGRREPERETLDNISIIAAHRLDSDSAGNPRWLVVLSDGTQVQTAAGAPCAYAIGDVAMLKRPLTVTLLDGELWAVRK